MQASGDIPITPIHRWRLWIPGSLIVIAAFGSFAPNSVASAAGLPSLAIESGAALIFVIVLIAMIRAARCARCKQNLLLRSMSNEKAGSWLTRFMEMKSCPSCGYPKTTNE
jgi:hypothetical protein